MVARWVQAIADLPPEAVELMSLCPQKRQYYLRGLSARILIFNRLSGLFTLAEKLDIQPI